jgi:type IV secretion system protein VirB10
MKAQERLLGSSGRVPSSIASLAAGAGTATAQVEGQGGERRNFYAEERGGGQDVADMRVSAEAVRQEVVRQGKFLDCALVTRLRADLVESEVVAMVVRDFVTLDGETVLVPAGTKLLGRAGAVQNVQQARVYLQFERLIYPDQRSAYFRRKSPATDALGAAGVDGDVDRHFFLQFGSALLLGVLDGLAAAVQGVASGGADPSVRDMILGRTSSNLATVVAGILNRYGNVVPTITVEPGAKLKVYFAEDVILTPYRATVPPARWGRGAGPAELPVNRWQRGLRR